MKQWAVYMHENRVNGKKYIGITCLRPDRRWRGGEGYRSCTLFYRAIKKHGWESFRHEILSTGLTQREAERLEMELIMKYQTQDPEKGYNTAPGGNVTTGVRPSEETRRKLSAANQGRKLSAESRAKIGAAHRGKQVSAEARAKISKPVRCVETGQIFESLHAAAAAVGGHHGHISQCCRGKLKKTAGYHWEYIDTESTPATCAGSQYTTTAREEEKAWLKEIITEALSSQPA